MLHGDMPRRLPGPTCRDCGTAIEDGNTCVECWRDRAELDRQRDREWWSE